MPMKEQIPVPAYNGAVLPSSMRRRGGEETYVAVNEYAS